MGIIKYGLLISFLLLLSLFYVNLGTNSNIIPSPLIGKPLPDFSLANLENGKMVSLVDFGKKPILFNVWASWCVACRGEVPLLKALSTQEKITVVGINYKDTQDKAVDWLNYWGNPYLTVLLDEQASFSMDLGVTGVPETYLVDSDGIVRWKWAGGLESERGQQALEKALQEIGGLL